MTDVFKAFNVEQFTYDSDVDREFINLKQLEELFGMEAEHSLLCLYINEEGLYGPQANAVLENHVVNLPRALTGKVREVLKEPLAIRQINEGLVKIKLREYDNKYGRQLTINIVKSC